MVIQRARGDQKDRLALRAGGRMAGMEPNGQKRPIQFSLGFLLGSILVLSVWFGLFGGHSLVALLVAAAGVGPFAFTGMVYGACLGNVRVGLALGAAFGVALVALFFIPMIN